MRTIDLCVWTLLAALAVSPSCKTVPAPAPQKVEANLADREEAFIAELEAIIQSGEDEERWALLAARIEAWPHGELSHKSVKRLNRALDTSWSHETRRVLARWDPLGAPIARADLWALARHLELGERELPSSSPTTHLGAITSFDARGRAALSSIIAASDSGQVRVVAHLRLEDVTRDDVQTLARWRGHDALETLILWDNQIGPPLARDLVDAGPWPALTRLDVGSNRLGGEGVVLLSSLAVPKLETLQLDWNEVTDEAMLILVEGAKSWPLIKRLMLSHNALTDEGIRAIATAESLARLEVLTLSSNPITDTSLNHLATSPRMAHIKKLGVARTRISAAGCALLEDATFTGLQNLDISYTSTGDACAEAIARATFHGTLGTLVATGSAWSDAAIAAMTHREDSLSSLQVLGLEHNAISPAGCAALATHPGWSDLRELSLSRNAITDSCLTSIANSPHMRKLEHLLLERAQISDAGLDTLAASPHTSRLVRLSMGYNKLTSASAFAIAKSNALARLRDLSLEGNAIGDGGLAHLIAPGALPDLRALAIGWADLTDASARLVHDTPSLARFIKLDLQGNDFTREGVKLLLATEHLSSAIRRTITEHYIKLLDEARSE